VGGRTQSSEACGTCEVNGFVVLEPRLFIAKVHSFADGACSAFCRFGFRFSVFGFRFLGFFFLIRMLDPVLGSGSSVTSVLLAVRRRDREAGRGSWCLAWACRQGRWLLSQQLVCLRKVEGEHTVGSPIGEPAHDPVANGPVRKDEDSFDRVLLGT
jgi:hypothetical protein